MAAGKDVPPAEAEDSEWSEEEEEEEEDDSDKEGKKEKESEDEKEDDKEDDEDDAFWPAEQFTLAVKYFPQFLRREVTALSKRFETVEALVLDKEKSGKKRKRGDSR